MALNVNIIGRDSEGNLRALKVNSEGNLEISDSLGWGELLQDISDKLNILVSGTIVPEIVRTTPLVVAAGSTVDLLSSREINKNYSKIIMAVNISAPGSSLMDGFPVVLYETAIDSAFDALLSLRIGITTPWETGNSSIRFTSKPINICGEFERITITNLSATADMSVRSVHITYLRG